MLGFQLSSYTHIKEIRTLPYISSENGTPKSKRIISQTSELTEVILVGLLGISQKVLLFGWMLTELSTTILPVGTEQR